MSQPVPILDLAAEYRSLRAEIDAAVARVVDRTAFVGGEEVRRFEAEFAAYLGAPHAIGVGNGSDAIELALQGLGIGAGDAVLTVPFTFAATVEAIVRCGATPLFVDIGDDFTIDVDAAAALLATRPVRALIAVHLYGQPADLDRLLPLARRHGVALIEDAAQAHGALDPSGRRGVMTAYSFYPTKNLGGIGDGGAVATEDDDLAASIRRRRVHGMTSQYLHTERAQNHRMSELEAGWLTLGLRSLDADTARRREIAAAYRSAAPQLAWQADHPRHVHHLAVFRTARRDETRRSLETAGVATAVHYPHALTEQPAWRDLARAACPQAEAWAASCVSVPMFPEMTDAEVGSVANALARLDDQ